MAKQSLAKQNSKFNIRFVYGFLLLFVLGTFQNCGAPKNNGLNSDSSTGGGDHSVVPVSPNQLDATAKSSQQIDLTWRDNSNNETGFRIERGSASSGPFSSGVVTFSLVYTTRPDEISYSDVGLLANTQYSYRISAMNAAGNSPVSASVMATTQAAPSAPPTAPSSLAASPTAATIVQLTWSDNSNNETYFKIERSASGGAFAQVATASPDSHSYQDINLNPATVYTYRVRANNSAGDSNYSNSAAATTPAAGATNTFTYVNTNIIAPNCVYCHGGATVSAGINYSSYAQIDAGKAGMMSAINANRMPPGAPLSAAQKSQLQSWISSGAPNN